MTTAPPDRPAPLVPADTDMRGLKYMPLDAGNLIDSDTYALLSGEEFKVALALWCKSWTTQVPAGSVPNNDRVLAHLVHKPVDEWLQLRAGALRNWVLCSDDRWYHPIVCKLATERMPSRHEFAQQKSAAAARKERERQDRAALFAALRQHGITPPYDTKTSELRTLAQQAGVTLPVTPPVTPKRDQSADLSHQKSQPKRDRSASMSQPPPRETTPPVTPVTRDKRDHVTAIEGEGEGEGEGEYRNTVAGANAPARALQAPVTPPAQGSFVDPPAAPQHSRKAYEPPDCPHDRIREAWAELLPELPQHTEWGETRARHLRSRWREKAVELRWPNADAGVAYFAKLFRYVRKSTFLMGKAAPTANRPAFQAELAWLVSPGNWAKVLEGYYHREEQR